LAVRELGIRGQVQEIGELVVDGASEGLAHELLAIVMDQDYCKRENHHADVYSNSEEHLVALPLLDALLPDVELQARLLLGVDVSEGRNVLQKSVVDPLSSECF